MDEDETLSPAAIARLAQKDTLSNKLGISVTSAQYHALNMLAGATKQPVASIVRDAIMEYGSKRPVFMSAYLEALDGLDNK